VGIFIAAYLAHAARVIFAAGAMFVVAVALWLVIGILTALAGIQTGTVVLISMLVIAVAGIAVGSYVSVRYITPNAVLHPVLAAVSAAITFDALTTQGDLGFIRIAVPVSAAVVAAVTAIGSRSSKTPPKKSLGRTRDR
jgi:hypothetical protein